MNSGPRILVVEDELPMRTALYDILSGNGYRVLVASDGAAGLEKGSE
jgi:DNA-binding response OmpR family regulator